MKEVRAKKLRKKISATIIIASIILFAGNYNYVLANEESTTNKAPAYTLIEEGFPSANSIIKNEYNPETNEFVPVYYRIDLNKKNFGSGNRTNSYRVLEQYISANYADDNRQSQMQINTKKPSIIGNFINNYAQTNQAMGGAIYNSNNGNIDVLTGDFVGNYAKGNDAYGGAIYNGGYKANINTLVGDFIGNYVQANDYAYGGAIYNSGSGANITTIVGDFISNYAKTTNSYYNTAGGAIYNESGRVIKTIIGDFINNRIESNNSAYGGAIVNKGSMTTLTGDFIGNYVKNNKTSTGGAIHNEGSITTITGDFIGNYANGRDYTKGGALYNLNSNITTITGNFIGNHAESNNSYVTGGAIHNEGTIGNMINSSFIGNYAVAKNNTAKGGAIWTNKDLNITTQNGYTSYISGNYVDDKNGKRAEAIYVSNSSSLNFINNTEGKTIIDDILTGNGSKLVITGDGTGYVQLNNDVVGFDVTLNNSTMHLGIRDNVLNNNNLTLNSGTLSMINNQAGLAELKNLSIAGNTNLLVDVDLANSTMDRIKAETYGEHKGKINVVGMNLLSDAEKKSTKISFAEKGLKDNVALNMSKAPDSNQTVAYTPIYKYNVSYNKSGEEGVFVFDRIASGNAGSAEAYNPAVLGSSTTATVGAVTTMNQTINHSFNAVDTFMNIPLTERLAIKNRNKYAFAMNDTTLNMGKFSPLYLVEDEEPDVWIKPYAIFENVPLKNGPKVNNIAYGTLIGFDTGLKAIGKGWDRVWTGYLGYNGATQSYSGMDSTQNGGLLGGTMTLYRGNFFNATTLNVGGGVANNQTMYGSEDFTMLMSGVGNKTGYNLEFKDGRIILQPNMLLAYTFINTFDYTNAAGVNIDCKPIHTIQLAPGFKLIGNTKKGWQPYASVNMVWNLMGRSNASANGQKLPEMYVKPYVQYGVGLQKRVKDNFTAYGQAMVHNGGRNGVALSAGFRWLIDKNKKVEKNKKEPAPQKVTVLKELKK